MSLRWICPLLGIAGVAIMVPFESTVTLTIGVLCLIGFVVTGLFLIASPEFLGRADDDG
jgi:hypothetical protein